MPGLPDWSATNLHARRQMNSEHQKDAAGGCSHLDWFEDEHDPWDRQYCSGGMSRSDQGIRATCGERQMERWYIEATQRALLIVGIALVRIASLGTQLHR